MENSNVQVTFNSQNLRKYSLLEKIKLLKRKADELNGEYHEIIEKLKFSQKDVEFMMNKIKSMDNYLDSTLQSHR